MVRGLCEKKPLKTSSIRARRFDILMGLFTKWKYDMSELYYSMCLYIMQRS